MDALKRSVGKGGGADKAGGTTATKAKDKEPARKPATKTKSAKPAKAKSTKTARKTTRRKAA
jgi:hypothetical protein